MKQVIVVRTDLNMSRGKVVAQSCHASIGALYDAKERWGTIAPAMLSEWEDEGVKKVCLRVESEADLLLLADQCEAANIAHYLVRDVGKTELPAGTITVLGIGPDSERHIDRITGDLGPY